MHISYAPPYAITNTQRKRPGGRGGAVGGGGRSRRSSGADAAAGHRLPSDVRPELWPI